jgi:hypothetical protein
MWNVLSQQLYKYCIKIIFLKAAETNQLHIVKVCDTSVQNQVAKFICDVQPLRSGGIDYEAFSNGLSEQKRCSLL